MTLKEMVIETRRHLKDYTETVWTDVDIKDFINRGILMIKKQVPEYFTDLLPVYNDSYSIVIDMEYEGLPAIFAASRCFEQDEQHYRATSKRNEFESALLDMETELKNSQKYMDKVSGTYESDYVRDVYYDLEEDDELLPLNP